MSAAGPAWLWVPCEEGGGRRKGQRREDEERWEPSVWHDPSLPDTHSQGTGPPPCPQASIITEGPMLLCTHSNSYSEAGTWWLLLGGWGEFRNVMSCWKGDRGRFSLPSPGSLTFAGAAPPHLSCTVRGGQRST